MKNALKVSCASAAIIVALLPRVAAAQAAPAASSPAAPTAAAQGQAAGDVSQGSTATALNEVIVTATPTVGGVKRLDAAFSEVSLSQETLKEAGLAATADLLKLSPGVYVESSGGSAAGANVEVAGFPSLSLTPYVTFELNGASMFPQAGQVFLEGSNLLRPDETLQRVELVQGGPAVLYGDGQPGLTANYILRRGTDTPSGDVGLTYGSEGAERVDGFYGGPINKDAQVYGSIGGYWNTSDGVRNPQFTADKGGQLTGTLSKNWADGSLMVFGRYEDFDDQFVTDTPIQLTGHGTWANYPGFSALTGTMSSKADQFLSLPVAPCTTTGCTPGSIPLNQANGRGVEAYTFGGEFNWKFANGVQLLDDFNVSEGVVHMDALYSSPVAPESLQAFINSKESADKLTGITGVDAVLTNNGSAVPLSGNVMEAETRYLNMKFRSVSNEIHLSRELFPGNTLTVGNRTVFYGVTELYYTGADILLQAQNNPVPISVNLTNGANTWQLTNSQGFVNGPSGANFDRGSGVNTAFFVSDSWKYNNLLLDAGVRVERQVFNETVENGASGALTSDPYQLWAKTGKYLTSGTTNYPNEATATSWTAGLNYEITKQMSAYVRANEGVHFLAFSDVSALPAGQPQPVETAYNYQIGWKFKNSLIYADVSAFYRTFSNVPVEITAIPIPGTTTTGTGTIVYGATTKGIEYSFMLTPFRGMGAWDGFSLAATGDYSYGTYTNTNGCIYYTGIVTETYCVPADNISGYVLARQPLFQTRVTPAYKTDTNWGYVKLWLNIEYVGSHYSDQLQEDYLGTYYDLSAGITGTVGPRWEYTLSGTNLTNEIGLSEENPRALFGSVPTLGTQLGRSIEGREVSLQVKYKF